jgi:amino acid permease
MPSAFGFAQAAFAGAGVGARAAAAAGAGAACGAAAALGAGVCDHAALDAQSETALAKINPAAIRIAFSLW